MIDWNIVLSVIVGLIISRLSWAVMAGVVSGLISIGKQTQKDKDNRTFQEKVADKIREKQTNGSS